MLNKSIVLNAYKSVKLRHQLSFIIGLSIQVYGLGFSDFETVIIGGLIAITSGLMAYIETISTLQQVQSKIILDKIDAEITSEEVIKKLGEENQPYLKRFAEEVEK